jgi:ferredoxin/flavodoxin---NADP+ reductase
MARWVEGRVTAQKRWTDRLLSLCVEAEIMDFQAGQFARLGLPAVDQTGEDMTARPYSFVNAPHQRPHEFFYAVVPDGPLTPRLARLGAGDSVWLAPYAAGFLTLSEVPDADDLWLVSTGTGIGPFLSILATDEPWRRFRHVVLLHGVRCWADAAYRDTVRQLAAVRGDQFREAVFLSREQKDATLRGRVSQGLLDGSAERTVGLTLSPQHSHAMLCGNPGMTAEVVRIMGDRGMKKHRRRAPGHITLENYW